MAKIDKTYHELLNDILKNGFKYEDPNRKGVTRIQIPSYQIQHNFKDGFPAITTKQLYWKGIVGELLWFLKGDTNIKYLVDNGINIWNKDAYNYYKNRNKEFKVVDIDTWIEWIKSGKSPHGGDLGRVYGAQWRDWRGEFHLLDDSYKIDQISNLIKGLKENPMGTRHIVTAWNPAELDDMALPPCHWSFEILVEPLTHTIRRKKYIGSNYPTVKDGFPVSSSMMDKDNFPKYQFTLKWNQRSVDTFLGLPFNIASYALLAHIIGKMTNMVPKGIIGDLSNVHIYEPHMDAVKEQLSRDVNKYEDSELMISTLTQTNLNNDNFKHNDVMRHIDNGNIDIKDFTLFDYKSYPSIKAEMLSYNK